MQTKPKIRFTNKNRSQFFGVLKTRVDNFFTENNLYKTANSEMVVKTITLIAVYFIPFICVLVFQLNNLQLLAAYSLMGIAMAGIGMCVMHDANHNAYSSNRKINKYLGYSLNLIGGMVYNWKLQHNVLHHTYTNIHGMDDDIADKSILRFSPHSAPKKIHKFQFIYVFFFYTILTIYWALLKDFVQLKRYKENGVSKANKKEYFNNLVKTIISKLLYVGVFIVVPIVVFGYSFWQIFGYFMVMHAIAGLVLGVVFQMAHSVVETSYPLPNEKGEIENDWAIHQLNTTMNFARGNRLLSWYVGGLNFQVEHHLFPNICHIHYNKLAPIVKQTCEEYGIPYLDSPSFFEALKSHVKMLKKFGYEFNLDLATM